MPTEKRSDYFHTLHPGAIIDLRGTTVTPNLLSELRTALYETRTAQSIFGPTLFTESNFPEDAEFSGVNFRDYVDFGGAVFHGEARFKRSHFYETSSFPNAVFEGPSYFTRAQFHKGTEVTFSGARFNNFADFIGCTFDEASFDEVRFANAASFGNGTFHGYATFNRARFDGAANFVDSNFYENCLFRSTFDGAAQFDRAEFTRSANFYDCEFKKNRRLGPLLCRNVANFTLSTFAQPISLEVTAEEIDLNRTRFDFTVAMKFSYCHATLDEATFNYPSTIRTTPPVHAIRSNAIRSYLDSQAPAASIKSLEGVDCALLTLIDTDLSDCRFTGAIHIDQLRLEGGWKFDRSPHGLSFRRPFKWTKRQVVEEERRWRATAHPNSTSVRSFSIGLSEYSLGPWGTSVNRLSPVSSVEMLTATYRQLRKSREDAKDEPGAADFYYGEMEMRRHSKGWGTAERLLLQAYWLLSGYGLRASRALGWLAVAMTATILLMMGLGLPDDTPKQQLQWSKVDGKVVRVLDKPDPKLTKPFSDRFDVKRFDKALAVTLNSVVFRSSGQDLTPAGGYIEMASRFFEPVLLGLAALAIRGRVKR